MQFLCLVANSSLNQAVVHILSDKIVAKVIQGLSLKNNPKLLGGTEVLKKIYINGWIKE